MACDLPVSTQIGPGRICREAPALSMHSDNLAIRAWVPLVAIPGLIAGLVADIFLMQSGIKGIIAARAARRNADTDATSGGVVYCAGTQAQAAEQERSRSRILIALPPPLP